MNADQENPRTLTVEAAARQLGIGRGLCYRLIREGRIPSIRLGRRIVVPVHALEHMLDPAATLDGPQR